MSLKMTDKLADGEGKKGKAAAQQGTVQDQMTDQEAGATFSTAAPVDPGFNLLSTLITANYNQALSTDGDKYLQNICSNVTKPEVGVGYKVVPSSNMHLFHKGGNVLALIFAENIPSYEKAATDVAISMAYKDFEQSGLAEEIGTLIEVVVVFPTDYDRAAQMIKKIVNSLEHAVSENFMLSALKGCKFRINTNLNVVQQTIAAMSPHGVASRVDYGLVLEMANERDTGITRMYGLRKELRYEPLAVVGGYTDIIRSTSSHRMQDRFLPLIHISEIQSNLQNIRFVPMLLAMAVDAFYKNNLWLAPFSSFTESAPNLGNLFFDPETGQPEVVTNRDSLKTFVAKELDMPFMVMDIQPGRSTIPGLPLLLTDSQRFIVESMIDFFQGDRSMMQISQIVDQPIGCLSGIVEANGVKIDSRYIDYFSLVKSGAPRELLDRFLGYAASPEDRLNAIQDAGYRNITPTYTTAMALINMQGLGGIIQAMSGTALDIQVDYATVQSGMASGLMAERSRQMHELVNGYGSFIGNPFQAQGASFYASNTPWNGR